MTTSYQQFECNVIVDGELVRMVPCGVRKGCNLSPIRFLLAVDWVMRKSTADRPRGIQWTLFSQLEDIDFAEELAALFS